MIGKMEEKTMDVKLLREMAITLRLLAEQIEVSIGGTRELKVRDLDLPMKTKAGLDRAGLTTVGDLMERGRWRVCQGTEGVGRTGAKAIKAEMERLGLEREW